MKSGIYVITNTVNGKQYIGQSKNIQKRICEHKSVKRESNKSLKCAYQKYGVDHFKFEVLEECPVEMLDEREIYYISQMKPAYNRTKGGRGPLGYSVSQETKNLLREYGKKQWARKSEEEKAKFVRDNLKGPKIGHQVSEETRNKLRIANLGNKQTQETIALRMKSLNALGHYQMLAEKRKRKVRCVETGEIFDSVKSAKNKYGETVSQHLRGIYKTCKGMHFEYLECRD